MSAADRKPSWQIADLTWKIRTDTLAAKLLLVFLGKCANNDGASWWPYSLICEQTGLCRDSIRLQTKYLTSLGILDFKSGGGRTNNRYKLKLETMKELVQTQAQQSQHAAQQHSAACSADSSACDPAAPSVPVGQRRVRPSSTQPSAEQPSPGCQAERNPHLSLVEGTNATLTEPGPLAALSEESSASQVRDSDANAQRSMGQGRAPSLRPHHSGNVPEAPSVRHRPETAERISFAVSKMGLSKPDTWKAEIQSLLDAGQSLEDVLKVAEQMHSGAPALMDRMGAAVFAEKGYWFKKNEIQRKGAA